MRIVLLMLALAFSLTTLAAGSDSSTPAVARDPDFDGGKQAIEAKNWTLALEMFGRASVRDPNNADIQNYLGYANRKSGNLDAAFANYATALRLDPRHKAAHEYVGEAYLMVNNLAKAEEHLEALDKICFWSCEEFRDLKREIDEYKSKHANK